MTDLMNGNVIVQDYTLNDLLQLKKTWVNQNAEYAQKLTEALKMIGTPVEAGRREYRRMAVGEYTALTTTIPESYDPDRKEGRFRTWLYVYRGDGITGDHRTAILLAQVSWTNFDDYVEYSNDQLFVPGEWQDRFAPFIGLAMQTKQDEYIQNQQKEIDKLRKLLRIGLEI